MTEQFKWNCPDCGYEARNILDALDHIVKEHTKDYEDNFFPHRNRRIGRRDAR